MKVIFSDSLDDSAHSGTVGLMKNRSRSIEAGVIAAAGKGTRAYPRTSFIPKPLFLIDNRSILERNVELLINTFKVKKIYILVGHLKDMVLQETDRIQRMYPGHEIIPSLWTGKGLASDIASLRDRIHGDFTVILGDELYFHTNHSIVPEMWSRRRAAKALVAVLESSLISDIRKNYSVELKGDLVTELIEKPENPPNHLLGLGTYVFTQDYFSHFDRTPPSSRSGVIELTEVIQKMHEETGAVHAAVLKGKYFNINSLADYYSANYFIRSEKFSSYRISLIIPSYNNESTLPDVISDFTGKVHEIIVADMGSTDRTLDVIPSKGVKVFHYKSSRKPATGYVHQGSFIYDAMDKAEGSILILASADGAFRARDLPKLLEYLKDSDMVVGTRTTRQLIEQGSNLVPLNRWLNVIFGKLVEIFWWDQEPRYTDIGCIYRGIWKDSYEKIREDLKAPDKTWMAEMMIEIVRYHMRCIEIPVSYYKQYGAAPEESREEKWRYFFSIFMMIFSRRFSSADRLFRLFR